MTFLNGGTLPQPASSTWGIGPDSAQSPSHKQTLIYHFNHQTWCFDFYIMGLTNTSGFQHHLSESQVARPENGSRLRHEWIFSTFLPLWRCCLFDRDEWQISKAVVDQKEGRRRERARRMVSAAQQHLLFSGFFLPAVFHCSCQRCRLCLRLKAVGGTAVLPQPWWL